MILKLFTKKDCPRCPAAKEVVAKLKAELAKAKTPTDVNFENFDVESVEGMAESAFYTVMSTPTILLCNDTGKEITGWRGESPTLETLKSNLKA